MNRWKTEVSRTIRITVVVENTAGAEGVLGEHGLAFWIEVGESRALFDTGQGRVLFGNAEALKIPLEQCDCVILSHGHHDHSGGLSGVLEAAGRAVVYAHPGVLLPKYGRNRDGTSTEIGMPASVTDLLEQNPHRLVRTESPTEVLPGLHVTGQVPRVTDFEDTGGPFFSDQECQKPDLLLDDQAAFFDSPDGTVVLLGCSHAGVINTLRYVRQLTNGSPIHSVIGGMHLGAASRARMLCTIDALKSLDIQRLAPAHCTGLKATTQLWSAFAGKCTACDAGTAMAFEIEDS